MGKLIDGDELLSIVRHMTVVDKSVMHRVLVQMPPVDAVEVVRCRDCTRWHKYNGEQFSECRWTFRVTKAEGYCDDAERKDGDHHE